MDIQVIRYRRTEESTQGIMFLDGEFFCYTIEKPWKNNEKSVSCIPPDTYKLDFRRDVTPLTSEYRGRFKWFDYHLEVKDVPGRTGIYIHVGNSEKDVLGCLAVGKQASDDYVGNSVLVFKDLYSKLSDVINSGESISLEIRNG